MCDARRINQVVVTMMMMMLLLFILIAWAIANYLFLVASSVLYRVVLQALPLLVTLPAQQRTAQIL